MKIELDEKAITYGSDVELFVRDENGETICPVDILEVPKQFSGLSDNGGWNRDGMALELNPIPASKEDASFILKDLYVEASTRLAEFGLSFANSVFSVKVPKDKEQIPPDVFETGCDPDYNAYTQAINPPSYNPRRMMTRYAGGHISFGLINAVKTLPTFEEICRLAKWMDATVGIYSCRFSPYKIQAARRKVYGRAGDFRWRAEKGIFEYRTPDSGWFWRGNIKEMLNAASSAFLFWSNGLEIVEEKQRDLVCYINGNNQSHTQSKYDEDMALAAEIPPPIDEPL